MVATLLIAIVAVRLHELVPAARILKPALSVGLIGLYLVLRSTDGRAVRSLMHNRFFRLVLTYFGWACVTAPFALWVGLAAQSVFLFLPALTMITVILLCRPTILSLERVQAGFVAATVLSAISLFAFGRGGGGRLGLPGSYDSNDSGAMLALSLPIALGLAFHTTGRRRWTAAAAAALLAAGVAGTGSRGGTLALVAGILTFVAGFRGRRRLVLLAAVLVVGLTIWEGASPAFRAKMTAMARGEQDYNETEYGGRVQIWRRARIYIAEHPVTGVGIGNFPVAEGEYLTASGRRGKWSAPHNAFVQATTELGIPGGLLFVALLVSGMLRSFPYWRPAKTLAGTVRHRPELLASIVAFVVSSCFLSHAYFFVFFALLGFVELTNAAMNQDMSVQPLPSRQRISLEAVAHVRNRRGP